MVQLISESFIEPLGSLATGVPGFVVCRIQDLERKALGLGPWVSRPGSRNGAFLVQELPLWI